MGDSMSNAMSEATADQKEEQREDEPKAGVPSVLAGQAISARLDRLPAFFVELLQGQYSKTDIARIVDGLSVRRLTSLRVNTLKSTAQDVKTALEAARIAYEAVPWSAQALVIPHNREYDLREMPIYTQGQIYLQSLSSQLPALILAPRAGSDVLDMCAAPGGKTTQMAALTAGKAHITACEMNAPRAQKLAHNLEVQGTPDVTLMRTDARRLDDFFSFDQILLDAPCTGSGTVFLNDPKVALHLTDKLLQKCIKSQRALLAKAAKLLKPGCDMVYSTCSILMQENEMIVSEALKKFHCAIVPIDTDTYQSANVPLLPTRLAGTMCVCPSERYEGFFVAKLRRLS